MRFLYLSTLLAAALALPAAAQDLPLEPGLYVGADTACSAGHPGNSFAFSQDEDGYLLLWATSYTRLTEIAPTDDPAIFATLRLGGSRAPYSENPPLPGRVQIFTPGEFGLLNDNGSVYPHARRCGPLPG